MSELSIIPLLGAQLVLQSVSAEASLAVNVTELRVAIEVAPADAPLVIVQAAEPVDVIEVLLPGAGGAPAPLEYERRVDVVAEDLAYRGEAMPGAADDAPAWRIRRITVDAAGAPVIEWANATRQLTARWSDRTTYTYE